MSIYLCVLDFEATCWKDEKAGDRPEIIEFPSVLIEIDINKNIKYISEFRKFVKPVQFPKLTSFCTELTGITQSDVDNADIFNVVYYEHYNWLNEHVPSDSKFFFVTHGNWDLLTMLPLQTKKSNLRIYQKYKQFINIKEEFKKNYHVHAGGMIDILNYLNIPLEGSHHSGIDDTKNITKIVIKMINDGTLKLL